MNSNSGVFKPKTKKEVVAEVPKISAQNLGNVYKVIIAPVITEKNAFLQSRYNQYVFKVTPSAKKEQIKQAVKELYGVTPDKIRIINMQGKYVRFGKYLGRRGDFKKALVTLPKGSSITIHESV
jgi:large subunit ribosomal protein L23